MHRKIQITKNNILSNHTKLFNGFTKIDVRVLRTFTKILMHLKVQITKRNFPVFEIVLITDKQKQKTSKSIAFLWITPPATNYDRKLFSIQPNLFKVWILFVLNYQPNVNVNKTAK